MSAQVRLVNVSDESQGALSWLCEACMAQGQQVYAPPEFTTQNAVHAVMRNAKAHNTSYHDGKAVTVEGGATTLFVEWMAGTEVPA